MAHRNNIESVELDDAFESSLNLGDVFEESRPNCALVKRDIKVKELSNEQLNLSREDSIQSPQNKTSNAANVTLSIKKEKLQSGLVRCIERMPFVKAERDINVGKSNDHSSNGNPEDRYLIDVCNERTIKEEYFIESEIIIQKELDIKDENEGEDQFTAKETQSEVNFSLKRRIKTMPTITNSVEEESLNTFNERETLKGLASFRKLYRFSFLFFSKCNKKAIKEEHFIKSEIIVQEELDIKDEDDQVQVNAESAVGQVKKKHHRSNRTVPLNRISISNCPYKTKTDLRQHELIHVPRELIKLHQCSECSYTSIWKSNVIRHLIKHKKPEDITYHKCTLCCYESSQKNLLTRHIQRVHRPKVNIELIHCTLCSHKTTRKDHLRQHMLVHKSGSEIQWFRCSECPFKTKHSSTLKQHILVHKSGTEIQWFRCSKCPFETKHSKSLKQHMVVHKSGSEIQWFRCSECPFKTKRSNTLKRHMSVHKSGSEIQRFRCSECPFKTKRSYSLKRHKLIHNLNSQKTLVSEFFYCYLCTLRTSRKDTLARHIQGRHRDTIGRIADRHSME